MNKLKVLIADDNVNVREIIRLYFEENQMDVIEAANGREALEKFKAEQPDIILLDVMMPEVDGLEVCRTIRKEHNTPIIMLTAKDEELDRVLGLEIGADDYVTKPFSPRELVARIKAILRRMNSSEEKDSAQDVEVYDLGVLKIHVPRREVIVNDEVIFFRPKEFDLLTFMVQHENTVLNREQLLQHVWGYDYIGDIRTVDVHVKKVREKLSAKGIECIHTVWGVGYRFELNKSMDSSKKGGS